MAVSGSGVSSIRLRLGLTKLEEGAVMLRHKDVVEDNPDRAWAALYAGETVFLELRGDNLVRVREKAAECFAAEGTGDE